MSMGVLVTSSWNGGEVKELGKKFIKESLQSLGVNAEGQAKKLCPVKYGFLKASINYQGKDFGSTVETPSGVTPPENYKTTEVHEIEKPSDENEVRVGTALDYAWAVEFGTVTHDIVAKNARVLSDMKTIYGTRVHHPGTDAQPFLRPTIDWLADKAPDMILVNGKNMFREYMNVKSVYSQTNEGFTE